MNFTPTDQQLEQNRSRAEDEIDLLQVLEALNRRWPWIAGKHPRPHLLRISTDRLQACLSRRISDRSQQRECK